MQIDLSQSPPQRILIIKPSALGDIVHTLPVLNLLRQRWPEAKISWLVGRAFAGLLEGHPQLDHVIPFDRRRFGKAWYHPGVGYELLSLVQELSDQKFDLVIDLQGLFRSGLLTALTRAPVRVGFANARELAHLFYTHHVPVHTLEQHAVDRYLSVTEALGCGRAPVGFHFATDAADRAAVDGMLNGVDRFALLLPGTNWVTKRWPAERYAEIIAPLQRDFGLSTVIGGGADDLPIASAISKFSADHLNLTGKTTLKQLVALIERAAVVIANDSGPMHIAAALGKPLVTPFGPTNPIRTGPYQRIDSVVRLDIPCSPCYSRKCSHISCMSWLNVDPVLVQIQNQIR